MLSLKLNNYILTKMNEIRKTGEDKHLLTPCLYYLANINVIVNYMEINQSYDEKSFKDYVKENMKSEDVGFILNHLFILEDFFKEI